MAMGAYNLDMLSIIIPTLNAAASLETTLKSLKASRTTGDLISQTIISDGGSTDDTRDIAAQNGATVINSPRGRGGQLAKGATVATTPWLLFLHADTQLSAGWQIVINRFISESEINGKKSAAVFKFALDDPNPAARRLERIVEKRCRWFGLPYGDQGLLISREHYDQIGGYQEMSLFEDVDIIRRIGRQNIEHLETAAITSAARYQKNGYIMRPLKNAVCLTLYFAGLPPILIERLYR